MNDLFNMIRGGAIKRYHTLEIIGEQSVASHSWGVAMILQYLDPNVSKEAILRALTHDVAELFTGDVPAPVKWDNPDLVEVLKRIEDKYESDKGPKVSSTAILPYSEENRASGLIYSGIFNSTSGINETNQFIQGLKITKDLNPEYGSIQKLHTRKRTSKP